MCGSSASRKKAGWIIRLRPHNELDPDDQEKNGDHGAYPAGKHRLRIPPLTKGRLGGVAVAAKMAFVNRPIRGDHTVLQE